MSPRAQSRGAPLHYYAIRLVTPSADEGPTSLLIYLIRFGVADISLFSVFHFVIHFADAGVVGHQVLVPLTALNDFVMQRLLKVLQCRLAFSFFLLRIAKAGVALYDFHTFGP